MGTYLMQMVFIRVRFSNVSLLNIIKIMANLIELLKKNDAKLKEFSDKAVAKVHSMATKSAQKHLVKRYQMKRPLVAVDKNNIPTKEVVPIDSTKAQQLYQAANTGNREVYGSYLYHVLTPQAWSMPHSENLKRQIAAAVAFDQSNQGFHDKRDNGDNMIHYRTWGLLGGDNSNINKQSSSNSASNIMGGLTYIIDNDSVYFPDTYSFGITRNNKGKVTKNDSFKNKPYKGLVNDIFNNNLGFRDIAENFGTRQGKTRDNSLTMSIRDINKYNQE